MEKYSDQEFYIGNILIIFHGNGWWKIRFGVSVNSEYESELEGLGNPFSDRAFNAIREEFMNDVGRRNCNFLKKIFDEHYSIKK